MSARVRRVCARCGRAIEPGRRVALTLGWEVSGAEAHRGPVVGQPARESRSTMVCPGCAAVMSAACGLGIPGAALAHGDSAEMVAEAVKGDSL